jgi:SAM-dependent methyltransferase
MIDLETHLDDRQRSPAATLAVTGFVGLFLELTLIRWAPAQASALGYYTNFVLLASFFGLGLGTLLRTRSWLLVVFPGLLFLTTNAFLWYGGENYPVSLSPGMYIWQMSQSEIRVSLPLFLAAAFVLLAAPFLPIGVAMAKAFRGVPPARGYAWNIAGSLAGIVSFAAMSALATRPWMWIGICAVIAIWLFPVRPRWWQAASFGLLALVVVQVFFAERAYNWSPYYRIELQPLHGDPPKGYELRVNTDYHQLVLDLSDEQLAASPELVGWRQLYDLPYDYKHGPDVMVVGAGTGNDVAAAIRAGAERVDVVEIDPLILEMGKRLHGERPYHSDRAHLYCDDARAFFRKTDRRYDLVVFGFLDSHTLLSSLSSVRLDSYVYTVQSLTEMKRLLKPTGYMALTFSVERDWIGQRLYRMVEEVFDEPPIVRKIAGAPGTVFLAGPGLDRAKAPSAPHPYAGSDILPATDHWPFLYFKSPGLPPEYAIAIVTIALIGFLLVSAVSWRTAVRPMPFFFALGAGFMLLETRSVTVMALLFGSTWLTNAVVFSTILVLILAATLWTISRPSKAGIHGPFALVLVSLVAVYFFPLDRFVAAPTMVKWLVAIVPMLPILFAGVLFARGFAVSREPDVAFGSNLLGALAGGLAEYASLKFGFPNLVWIAMAWYLTAWLTAGVRGGPLVQLPGQAT